MLVLEFNFNLTDLIIAFLDWNSRRLSALSIFTLFLLFTAFLSCLLDSLLSDVDVQVEILLIRCISIPLRKWPLLSLIWILSACCHFWILSSLFRASWLETMWRSMHKCLFLFSTGWALAAVLMQSGWPTLSLARTTTTSFFWSWSALSPRIWVFDRNWCWLLTWKDRFPVSIEPKCELFSCKSDFFLCNAQGSSHLFFF